ncbi:hypothetical protein MTR67_011863 [Solanum verrucosum]|uniref:Uncharacterized protein n=1 Tax=Solanum verrucosum TaxID=315347 RepID=A0AAF0Q8V3_SOLVR|nr:hypothetical protein MTR67_011863 [Solanum verrucosum]
MKTASESKFDGSTSCESVILGYSIVGMTPEIFNDELGTLVDLSTAFHQRQMSLRTITVTVLAFRWPRLRPYIVGVFALRLDGLRLQSLDRWHILDSRSFREGEGDSG